MTHGLPDDGLERRRRRGRHRFPQVGRALLLLRSDHVHNTDVEESRILRFSLQHNIPASCRSGGGCRSTPRCCLDVAETLLLCRLLCTHCFLDSSCYSSIAWIAYSRRRFLPVYRLIRSLPLFAESYPSLQSEPTHGVPAVGWFSRQARSRSAAVVVSSRWSDSWWSEEKHSDGLFGGSGSAGSFEGGSRSFCSGEFDREEP